jgi:hypothetical protein
VDVELEALWTLATWFKDFVLDQAEGPSSLAASLSTAVELLEGWVNATAVNGVCWGTRSALVTALSHFPELEAELELHRSVCNAAMLEDLVDVL